MQDNKNSVDIHSPFFVDFEKFSNKHALFQEYYAKINKSSDVIIEALKGPETRTALYNIRMDNEFDDSQASNLSRIVRDVLLGDLYLGDMPDFIKEKLQIESQAAKEIASTIVSQIFTPAMADIKKMQIAKFKDRIGKGPATPTIDLSQSERRPTERQVVPRQEVNDTDENMVDLSKN